MSKPLIALMVALLVVSVATLAVLMSRRQPAAEAAPTPPAPTPKPPSAAESLKAALEAKPVPVEWPQLRVLDEEIHKAHQFSLNHDHANLYALLPTLRGDVQDLLANPVPKLPGADEHWMKRRVAAMQSNLEALDGLIARNETQETPAPGMPFWWKGDASAYKGMALHETVNSLIDNVEVVMGATAAEHKGILRAEHVHTDHQCGP